MKKEQLKLTVLIGTVYVLGALIGIAYADPSFVGDPAAVNVASGATVVLPAAVPTGPLQQILNALLPAILALLTGLLAWASSNLQTWVKQMASKANTVESAAWYATALSLAGIAVRYAYDKYGPDTAKAADLRKDAATFLKDRLIAIDKDIIAKNPNLDHLIEGLVSAAYTEAFKVVAPLAPSPALK